MRLGSCGGCGARAPRSPVGWSGGVVRDGRAARLVRRGGTGRRITVPGGQPQLDRSTSSVGSNCALGRRPGRAIRSSRRVQACSPSSRIGWWTVVSGGSYRLPGKMSSKPTTATCSGTRTPAFAKACSTPMAIWSFAQTTASGSEFPLAASSFSPASSPLPTLNMPSYLPRSWQAGWAPSSSCSARRRSLASGAVGGPSTWYSRRLPWSSIRWDTRAAEPARLSAVTTSAARSLGSPAMTTTGSRLASRARNGEGTTPSPISRPST